LFVGIIILLVEKNLKNLVIFSSFLLIYNLTSITYQSYVDPIFYIIILTILNFKNNINILNKKMAILFLMFYSLMLCGSILFRTYVT